jgi:hypothetical protein
MHKLTNTELAMVSGGQGPSPRAFEAVRDAPLPTIDNVSEIFSSFPGGGSSPAPIVLTSLGLLKQSG